MSEPDDLVVRRPEGLYCPPGGFYIDPWRPVERAVITHAHADHARRGHGAYLATAVSAGVLRARLGPIALQGAVYGEAVSVGGVRVSLHPAGHVLGSAQVRIEHRGRVWVASGDYFASAHEDDRNPTCAPFEPVRCDCFITESTFGLPVYRWRPQRDVLAEVNAWWSANAEAGRPSLLLAYSFGKAQRLLAGVDASIGPIVVHAAVEPLNEAYRAAGVALPPTRRLDELRGRPELRRALVVADANVAVPHGAVIVDSLRAAGFAVELLTVDAGEETKSVAWLARIWDRLGAMKLGRDGLLVAVGGGVIGDLVGFAAASWLRGVDFVQVPTSLLAMVDSSVGGKTGINHETGKNLIGAFWQPRLVLADLATLATLSRGERISGMAEVIKYGVIRDADFFAWLEREVEAVRDLAPAALAKAVYDSCAVKAEVVGADERETSGLREILNFGHTVGHALENSAGYGALRHGEAISIGMVVEGRLALGRHEGWTPLEQARLESLLERAGLPLRVPKELGLTLAAVQEAAKSDKKNRAGTVRYMLPTRLGEVVNVALADADVAPELLKVGVLA